jgi:hypothetical protein
MHAVLPEQDHAEVTVSEAFSNLQCGNDTAH